MSWLLSTNSKSSLKQILVLAFLWAWFSTPSTFAKEPFLTKQVLFEEKTDGFSLYRIPGIVVTAKGTILVYCEGRKLREADRGEIEIHLRRSADGGETFSPAREIAHMGPRLPRNPYMSEKKLGKKDGRPKRADRQQSYGHRRREWVGPYGLLR